MTDLQFPARALKPYAEPITQEQLREGNVYFSVQFVDDEMLIPIIETWAFAGRKLEPKDPEDRFYFQDVESYRYGIRYGSVEHEQAKFRVAEGPNLNMYDYEHTLNEMLKCSLRRKSKIRNVQ
jgi:hypothetical protein